MSLYSVNVTNTSAYISIFKESSTNFSLFLHNSNIFYKLPYASTEFYSLYNNGIYIINKEVTRIY